MNKMTKNVELLERAVLAAQETSAVIERAIQKEFGEIGEHGNEAELEEMMAEASVFAPGLAWAFFSPVVALGAFVVLGGVFVKTLVADMIENSPSARFNKAARKLESATERFPAGPEKQLFRTFLDKAKRCFTLARVACLQEEIKQGKEPVAKLVKAQKKGVSIINKAAAKWRWTDGESLKAAFRTGQLQSPRSYGEELSQECRTLQDSLYWSADRAQKNAA